jgi:cell division protein FtsB
VLPVEPEYSPTPPSYDRYARSASSSVSSTVELPTSTAAPRGCIHLTEIALLTEQRKTMTDRNNRLNNANNHLRSVNKLLSSRVDVMESKCRRAWELIKVEEDEFAVKQKCSAAFHERYQQSYKQKCKSLREVINDFYDVLGYMEQHG